MVDWTVAFLGLPHASNITRTNSARAALDLVASFTQEASRRRHRLMQYQQMDKNKLVKENSLKFPSNIVNPNPLYNDLGRFARSAV